MKKIILFSFSLMTIGLLKAQEAHFGLKGGLNVSSLHYKGTDASNSKIGFHVGGLAHIHITPTFAIQPEIMYSLQGGKSTVQNVEYKTNLHYIDIPVLGQYMFGNGWRIEAGPQLGLLVAAKQKYGSTENDIKSNFKTTDFSLVAGIGYVTPSGFGIDGRWLFGISNINENANGPVTHNSTGQFGIFYLLEHGNSFKQKAHKK